MNFHILLYKDLREQVRTHRLLAMASVFLAFSGFLSPIAAKFAPRIIEEMMRRSGQRFIIQIPEPTIADAIGQFLKNTTQIGIIVLILVAMGSMALERETAAMTLSKPVSRLSFMLSKFSALSLTVFMSFSLSSLVFYLYTIFLFGHLDPLRFLSSALLLFLYLWVWAALTFLFSTISRSQIFAGGMAFGLYIISSLLGTVPHIKDYMPWALIRGAEGIALGFHTDVWRPIALGLASIAISLLASYEAFIRQEI
jgi:ABC-2 type transport system permease protein